MGREDGKSNEEIISRLKKAWLFPAIGVRAKKQGITYISMPPLTAFPALSLVWPPLIALVLKGPLQQIGQKIHF